jgi:AraC-like DNA-binding protein
MISRPPCPPLRPFVRLLWATEEGDASPAGGRERLLPTGAMHLALRTAGEPVRVFAGAADVQGTVLGHAVVGGARTAPYLRDVSRSARSVGAMLEPGAALLLFGAAAGELAGRHTSLPDLWGAAASETRERIALAGAPSRQLEVLEAILLARLPRVRGIHPAVAEALSALAVRPDVGAAVARSGYSHRRFIELFREAVGLAPKAYCRVLRFQRAVTRIHAAPDVSLGEVAAQVGYADQAHLSRDFLELSGTSPGRYRRAAPLHPNHLPLP